MERQPKRKFENRTTYLQAKYFHYRDIDPDDRKFIHHLSRLISRLERHEMMARAKKRKFTQKKL